jgi:hypothetical protein
MSQKRVLPRVRISDVPAVAVGSVYDYLHATKDVRRLRRTCRHFALAFDAAIDNECATTNAIALREDASGVAWRWCPLFRIPAKAGNRARRAYVVKEIQPQQDSTVACGTVVIHSGMSFSYWQSNLRNFWDVSEVEVHGKVCCRSFGHRFGDPPCQELVHTILPVSPCHALFLHGRRGEQRSRDTCLSIRQVNSLKSQKTHGYAGFDRSRPLCDGVRSIQLRLGDDKYCNTDTADALKFLLSTDLSRLVDLDVEMTTANCEAFVAQLVTKASSLERFTLRGNLTDMVVYVVAARCPKLRQVDLTLRNAPENVVTVLVSSCPEVEHVEIRCCWPHRSTGVAFALRWRHLRYLDVPDATMTNRALAQIGRHYPQLEHLHTSDAHDPADPVSDVGVAALARGCPRLLYLNLSVWKRLVGNAGVIAVAEHCTSLTHLNLSSTGVSDAGFVAVAKHCRRLEHLNLSRTFITNIGAVADAGAIPVAVHCTALTYLDLSSTGVSDAGVVAVAKHCSLLEHLDLSRTSVTNVAVSAIATSLPLLRCLDLTETAVDCTGIVPLGEGCARMEKFWASITDSSAIERVLPHWPRLKKLHLAHMLPTASLFAAFGRYNHQLLEVRLTKVDPWAFSQLARDAHLVFEVYGGTWVRRTAC